MFASTADCKSFRVSPGVARDGRASAGIQFAPRQNISFPFTATATVNGYQFAGQFKINRRDFKVGGGSMVLSDDLKVLLNISANKQ